MLWLEAAPLFSLHPFGTGWPLWPVRSRCLIPPPWLCPSVEPPHSLWLCCWAKRHQCVFKGQWFPSQGPLLALTGACTCTSWGNQQQRQQLGIIQLDSLCYQLFVVTASLSAGRGGEGWVFAAEYYPCLQLHGGCPWGHERRNSPSSSGSHSKSSCCS